MRDANRRLLGPHDTVLAAHPGSGGSWIATLLVHLGIFYVSGHNEDLLDRARQETGGWIDDEQQQLPGLGDGPGATAGAGRPSIGFEDQMKHLPALLERDRINPTYREPWRVIKTNQAALGWTPPGKVLLLVRDGRDALLSLYHNLRSFSDLEVPLLDYLTGNSGAWLPPAMSWGFACMSWVGSTPPERLHVLKFEACRERPLEEFRAMLRFLGVEREDAEIEHGIAQSSYDRMRRVEEAAVAEHGSAIGDGRIMRKGQVGEWRDVYSPEMLRTFRGLPSRALAHFGYPTDTIPAARG